MLEKLQASLERKRALGEALLQTLLRGHEAERRKRDERVIASLERALHLIEHTSTERRQLEMLCNLRATQEAQAAVAEQVRQLTLRSVQGQQNEPSLAGTRRAQRASMLFEKEKLESMLGEEGPDENESDDDADPRLVERARRTGDHASRRGNRGAVDAPLRKLQRQTTLTASPAKTSPRDRERDAPQLQANRQRARGARLFKAAARAALFSHRTKMSVLSQEGSRRERHLRAFREVLDLYVELSRKWMRPVLKTPLVSVLQHAELSLSLAQRSGVAALGILRRLSSPDSIEARVLKVRVRVRSILDGLLSLVSGDAEGPAESAAEATPPPAVVNFVTRYLIDDKLYFPDDSGVDAEPAARGFLWASERAALEFDKSGATTGMNAARKRMMIIDFFFGRVLIPVVLRPSLARFGAGDDSPRGNVRQNLRLLASIIQRGAQQAVQRLVKLDARAVEADAALLPGGLLPAGDEQLLLAAELISECRDSILSWADKFMAHVAARGSGPSRTAARQQ
jgi:hypothetical protein